MQKIPFKIGLVGLTLLSQQPGSMQALRTLNSTIKELERAGRSQNLTFIGELISEFQWESQDHTGIPKLRVRAMLCL